jgi:hypothetical protein
MPALRVSNEFGSESQHLVGAFSLTNVCAVFFNSSRTLHHVQFVSLDGMRAFIHGFSERQWRFHRLALVRPAEKADANVLDRCEWRSRALALHMSANHFYHQSFHAIPAYAGLHHTMGANATLLPLVGTYAGDWFDGSVTSARFWEFTVRALTTESPEGLTSMLRQLLWSPCTCFEQVVGDVSSYSWAGQQERYVAMASEWRLATLQSAGVLASRSSGLPVARDALYLARVTGSRVVTNEAELVMGINESGRVQRVVMERLTLTEQMRRLASTRMLVGVHGQALALMFFMPWDTQTTAVLEIIPQPNEQAWHFSKDLPDMGRSLGMAYEQHIAQPVCGGHNGPSGGARSHRSRSRPQGCVKNDCVLLRCNVTVNVSNAARAVRRLLEQTRCAVGHSHDKRRFECSPVHGKKLRSRRGGPRANRLPPGRAIKTPNNDGIRPAQENSRSNPRPTQPRPAQPHAAHKKIFWWYFTPLISMALMLIALGSRVAIGTKAQTEVSEACHTRRRASGTRALRIRY